MKQNLMNCLIATAACCLTACDRKPQEANLVLLYTTDVHGACLHYDFNKAADAKTSLANVSTYLKEQRAANPGSVMLFDTGDFLQGQPSMYYYNYIDTTHTHVYTNVFKYLGYDAVGVGNHDIETGEPCYGSRLFREMKDAGVPWICANAIDIRTGKPMFQPYIIIERHGMKIAVLGLITPNIGAWLPKQLWEHLEFQDMVECAQEWVPKILADEKPDLMVGLFHAGGDYTADGANMDTYKNENGSVPVAVKVPGFDLILCGHDHRKRLFNVANVNGDSVAVMDANTRATFVGRADIHMTRNADGSFTKQITTSLVAMDTVAVDQDFCKTFQPAVDIVNKYVDSEVGDLTGALLGRPSLVGPSLFIDLIHNVQLWATGADISMASVLSPNDNVQPGKVTMRTLFTLYKYENKLFSLRMTGAEVKKYLEFGFDRQFNILNPKDIAKYRRFDKNVTPLLAVGKTPTFNYTCAAGIKYTLDLTKPEGEKVTILSMSDGTPFDENKEYIVAVNSYQASGGGQFIPVGLGWDEATLAEHTVLASDLDVRYYVAEYFRNNSPIVPALRGDWQIIPTDLYEAAKAHSLAESKPDIH